MRGARVITGLVIVAMVLSGCSELVASPEETAKSAIENFPAELGPDGTVKELDGTFESSESAVTAEFSIEIGSNGVRVFSISASIVNIKVYCGENRGVTQWGDKVLEARTDPDMCTNQGSDPGESVFEGEIEVQNAERQDDGTISADVVSTSSTGEESTIDVTLDEEGRIASMTIANSTGRFEFEVDHGSRRTIDIPETTDRRPADVTGRTTFRAGNYTWTATAHNDSVPLEEFEVRVTDTDQSGDEVVVATFDPSRSGTQEENGFSFRFEDNGDGALTTDDWFTVSRDDWEYEWDYDVVVWDEWAEAGIDEVALPFPGVVWIGSGIAAAAIVLRRRRRGSDR